MDLSACAVSFHSLSAWPTSAERFLYVEVHNAECQVLAALGSRGIFAYPSIFHLPCNVAFG